MEAAIRFSRNSTDSEPGVFLKADVVGRSFKLCRIRKTSTKKTSYDAFASSEKVPLFRAFDWHPIRENLIAVGQSSGEATLINIADKHRDSTSFPTKSQRLCNAVALNTENWIAVGLERARSDTCLNLWDFTERLPTKQQNGLVKSYTEPTYRLAAGEPITSLKFFYDQPKILAAGVKGQFIRLYDLREASNIALQFATRCVHNIAIDELDQNYLASCYPANDPSICLWDRRMISRTQAAQVGFSPGLHQSSSQPEVSLELKNITNDAGQVWSLRFSKSQRGHLGVLTSTGRLRVFRMNKEDAFDLHNAGQKGESLADWTQSNTQSIYLNEVQDVHRAGSDTTLPTSDNDRIVSFDFMTTNSKYGLPKIITLSKKGNVNVTKLRPHPQPASFSSTGFMVKGETFWPAPVLRKEESTISVKSLQIKREAESRNVTKKVVKQSKLAGEEIKMSSYQNHAWNLDLGLFEMDVPIEALLLLNSQQRLRCEEGYLLDAVRNQQLVSDDDWLQAFWAWVEHADRIAAHQSMVQNELDLSYLGVFGLWMEEFDVKPRVMRANQNLPSVNLQTIIKSLSQRLNIDRGHGCSTEYPFSRALCLYVIGAHKSLLELENVIEKLTSRGQHTKGAALAVFAGEENLAQKVLKAKGSTQSHKLLAMALAGGKLRPKADNSSYRSPVISRGDAEDDEWSSTINSLVGDVSDPYARAILSYVRALSWDDVVASSSLPLKYRVEVAVRHFDDSKLTTYLSKIKSEVMAQGDIEGIILTGLGTPESVKLLSMYAKLTGDVQTATLGLSYAGLSEKFLSISADGAAYRTVLCFRQAYRKQIMSWNLKFEKAKFDVALSRAVALWAEDGKQRTLPTPPKQQIRLVCTHCTQPIAQSEAIHGSDESVLSRNGNTSSVKNPLAPEKAAAIGTVCPKCNRHLPRCGVCDMWLGTPDESYSKWFARAHGGHDRGFGSIDMAGSYVGSVVTAIGPGNEGTPFLSVNTNVKGGKAFTSSGSRLVQNRSAKPESSANDSSENRSNHGTTDVSTSMTGRQALMTEPNETAVEESEATSEEALRLEREKRWVESMHRFTVFCLKCAHGFHAEHARAWFGYDELSSGSLIAKKAQASKGTGDTITSERGGYRVCPVPECSCRCAG